MNNTLKKVWSIVSTALVVLMVLCAVFLMGSRVLGFQIYMVLSGSMEPAISIDDLIIIRAADSFAVGDVVVYQNGRVPVVHRIVAMDGEMVTTRGDANNTDDDPMDISLVKGKVIAAVPYVGKVVRLLKTPIATVLMIVAAVLCVELPYRKEKDKKEEELERIKAEIRRLKEEQDT